MIFEFTIDTAYRLGNVIDGSHRLRKTTFVDRQGWSDIPITRDDQREFDQFDTLDARYLVGIDANGIVRAVCRNLFCDRPWMLKSLWADILAPGVKLPSTADWAEGTRMLIDPTLDRGGRDYWQAMMSCAGTEWGLHYGVKHYTFVTYAAVCQHLEKTFDISYWGDARDWPTGAFRAGHWEITEELLAKQRRLTGIQDRALVPLDEMLAMDPSQRQAAA